MKKKNNVHFRIFRVVDKSMFFPTKDKMRKPYYEQVFENTYGFSSIKDNSILNSIFSGFNLHNNPALTGQYKGASMSVGDIVTLNDKVSYVCRTVGWERLDNILK